MADDNRSSLGGSPVFPDLLRTLDAAVALVRWPAVILGGPRFPPACPGDPPVRCQPHPRLTIILDGCMRYGSSQRGRRVITDATAGQLHYWASHSWDLDFWGAPTALLGMVFHPQYLRVLRYAHPGGPPPTVPARMAHHTRQPLGRAGRQVLEALDALTDEGPPPELRAAAADLLRALLSLVRAHVVADLAEEHPSGASRTWQEAVEYLAEHLAEPLSRASVARALGLHPNYLSTLCTEHGGRSFHATLEAMRIAHAQAALRQEPQVRIAELARRCGYGDAGHFIRVFRRATGETPGRAARLQRRGKTP